MGGHSPRPAECPLHSFAGPTMAPDEKYMEVGEANSRADPAPEQSGREPISVRRATGRGTRFLRPSRRDPRFAPSRQHPRHHLASRDQRRPIDRGQPRGVVVQPTVDVGEFGFKLSVGPHVPSLLPPPAAGYVFDSADGKIKVETRRLGKSLRNTTYSCRPTTVGSRRRA